MYENGNIEGSKRNNLWAKYLIALSVTLGLISLIVYWTLHFTVLDPKYRKYVSHLAD